MLLYCLRCDVFAREDECFVCGGPMMVRNIGPMGGQHAYRRGAAVSIGGKPIYAEESTRF